MTFEVIFHLICVFIMLAIAFIPNFDKIRFQTKRYPRKIAFKYKKLTLCDLQSRLGSMPMEPFIKLKSLFGSVKLQKLTFSFSKFWKMCYIKGMVQYSFGAFCSSLPPLKIIFLLDYLRQRAEIKFQWDSSINILNKLTRKRKEEILSSGSNFTFTNRLI